MRRYSYAVAESVVRLLPVVSRRDRELLLKAFSALADDPFQRGDYFIRVSGQREVQMKRAGHWLIHYWADHGACEVRIVDVEVV
jgi:hypothetical protein